MRLVDIDNIRDILTQDWFLDILLTQNGKAELAKELSNLVYSIPVAYDVDKVIKQIEEKTKFLKDHKKYETMMMYEIVGMIEDLIDIIRAGGKEQGNERTEIICM